MDLRTALLPNTELRFGPETVCIIRGEIGRGGSCIVYDGYYRTNAGDEKTVRIKECYPHDLQLRRAPSGALVSSDAGAERFTAEKERMYADFRLCNSLFYAEPASDAIISTINIYEANNTVYSVSAWSRENALPECGINSLRDCISIARQTAAALRSVHRAGYLYLDIKPDNIAVVNSSSKRVQLFDFDSLIPLAALKKEADSSRFRLSYTKGFAALELRRGQLSRLGPYTDVYGIGALLFFLLFGRTPEAPDCSGGAVYDFSALRFPGTYPDRLFILLSELFRRSLAGFAPDRYASMDPLIGALEKIEKLADPGRSYVISSVIDPPVFFLGRDPEREALEGWYRDETRNVLFVTGMGGIGKSTFIRRFLVDHRSEWDSIAFLYFSGTVRQTVCSDEMLRIAGTERFPEEKESDYFERKLVKLREIAARDRILLVIDNFEGEYDPDLEKILRLGLKTLLLTRHSFGSLNLPVLRLGPLRDEEDLERLFIHYLDREVSDEDILTVKAIIRHLSGHTLAAELFARQIAASFLSLREALDLLETQGILHVSRDRVDYRRDDRISYDRLETVITRLFETDRLSDDQISLLKAAALFPAPGIEPGEFLRLTGSGSAEPLARLTGRGWVTREQERIFLHPLILDVVRNIPPTGENCRDVLKTLLCLYENIMAESHIEELYVDPAGISAELAEKLSGIDPYTIVTDHRKLQHFVMTARGVIDALRNDPLWDSGPVRKLMQAMVTNLPKYEDGAILYYGEMLLGSPEHLSPVEVLAVIETVESVYLERRQFDAAFSLTETAKAWVTDDRTAAEYYFLYGLIFDVRDGPGDREKNFEAVEQGLLHARKAPHPLRKHLLAEFLLGKMNSIARYGSGDEAEFDELFEEMRQIAERDCLPYSEIRHGFAITMGFYWAEIGKDLEETQKWIDAARLPAEKLYPIGLDYIDRMIIPPAIMYIDLQEYDACEAALREGIRICDEYPGLTAYLRKKHDLQRYLLDVYLESGAREQARRLLALLDEESARFAFPDTVLPEIRSYLAGP